MIEVPFKPLESPIPMKNLSLALVAGVLLTAGCATVDADGGNSIHSTSKDRDMNYLTGSKIPLRSDGNAQGTKVTVPTDLERQEMSRPVPMVGQPRGG